MAKCVKIEVPPVKQPSPQYQLTLTEGEAWALFHTVGKTGGCPSTSPRLFVERLYYALRQVLPEHMTDQVLEESSILMFNPCPDIVNEFLANE